MNKLSQIYYTLNDCLFPILNVDLGELTEKMKDFLRILEVVRPARFLENIDIKKGFGRPQADREKILRAFILKAVYNYSTTKALIENLKTNSILRVLCGWNFADEVPSEATFSRVFATFSKEFIPEAIHASIIKENYTDKIVGHSSIDSTAILGREKAHVQQWEKADKQPKKEKKKRGRKSKAEKELLAKQELTEPEKTSLQQQGNRSLEDNIKDLPIYCDWGSKHNSKGKFSTWCGYKFHIATGDGDIPLGAILTSASIHDSQVAIPLMQKVNERATVLYDLADAAYDAKEIHNFSAKLGHVPIIDKNKRNGEIIPLAPAEKKRYCERSSVERTNSDLKDNHCGTSIRVKGYKKVFSHLMFSLIVITVKQMFSML